MEIEVRNRIKSICCREGNIFRKYYRYSNDPSVDREARIANLFMKEGLPVAKYLKTGFSYEKQMRYNEFEFIDITTINEENFDADLMVKSLDLIKRIQRIKYNEDAFWNTWYETDLFRSLEYSPNLKDDTIKLIEEVKNYPKALLHGDFSLRNFGYKKGTKDLFLYDFQTACNGPLDWDIAYFMATLPISKSSLFEYDERILTMIRIATAVRLGRALRKNIDLKMRREIQEYWWSK